MLNFASCGIFLVSCPEHFHSSCIDSRVIDSGKGKALNCSTVLCHVVWHLGAANMLGLPFVVAILRYCRVNSICVIFKSLARHFYLLALFLTCILSNAEDLRVPPVHSTCAGVTDPSLTGGMRTRTGNREHLTNNPASQDLNNQKMVRIKLTHHDIKR
jgi:hypothetical protein